MISLHIAATAAGVAFRVLLPQQVSAQPPRAPSRPTVGVLTVTHPAGATRAVLPNGLTLVMLPFGSTPKTEIRVVLDLSGDVPTRSRARAFLPALWRAGTAELTGDKLADSLERIGASLGTSANNSSATLSLDLLSSALRDGLDIVANIMRRPRLDSAFLASLNGGRRGGRGIGAGANAGALATFENAIANAASTSTADVASIPATTELAAPMYAGQLSTERMTVYLTGQFDVIAARAIVTKTFGSWPRASRGDVAATIAPKKTDTVESQSAPSAAPSLIVIQRTGARQNTLVVGAAIAPPADSAFARFRVVDALLGGSLSSRITMNIREAKGFVYSPASRLTVTAPNRAYWAEVVDVPSNFTWPTLREILREIAGVDSTPPLQTEVSNSARFVVGSALMRRAGRSGWCDEVEENRALGKPWGDWDAGLRIALTTSPTHVRTLVNRYLAPSRLTIVLEADTIALGAQLTEIRSAVAALRAR